MKKSLLTVFVLTVISVSTLAQSIGSKFPNMEDKTIDNELLTTKKLKGKVVFYNFYFAFCQPCIAEKEGLKELYETYASDDVLFVSITFDNSEIIKQFQTTHGMRFKAISISLNEIARRFGVRQFPVNFLVGADGTIVMKKDGIESTDTANQEILAEFSPVIQSELQKLVSKK